MVTWRAFPVRLLLTPPFFALRMVSAPTEANFDCGFGWGFVAGVATPALPFGCAARGGSMKTSFCSNDSSCMVPWYSLKICREFQTTGKSAFCSGRLG
jgi:hypothetical protein